VQGKRKSLMNMNKTAYPWLQSYPDGIEWDIKIPAKPVFSMLDESVAKFANRPAFDFLGKKSSWGEINDRVTHLAKGLQELGVKKGDKVGLFLPNCPYFVISYYAVLKAGGTVVNFNPLYAERELKHQIEDSGTKIMITADLAMLYGKMKVMIEQTRLEKFVVCSFTDILPFPKNILFRVFKKKELARTTYPDDSIAWFHELINNDGKPEPVAIDPKEDIAVLQYTGGTTGVPKGAMLTHYNVYANTVQSLAWFPDFREGQDRMLGVLPFFHVFAMTAVMNFSVLAGLEIVALPRFDLKQTLKTIHKTKPHFFPAVPAIYAAINNYKDRKSYDLSSIRYCISGGAPLPVEVKKAFEKNTGCVVIEGYGLTESSPVACANPLTGDNIAGSIGLPLPDTIIEIVSTEDRKTLMKIGERGELCIRGPQVMKGYWNKPEDTADVLKDGLLHTGDVAIMDEKGYVYIVDRIKDMIITNGYNVYPRNVEEAIYQHPAIEECIVAGLPDASRGEMVKAWVKLKKGQKLTDGELKTFLQDKISKMEIPREIEFRDKPLPKTMIGKLSRKDIVAEELAKRAK
jgi:long-chain acyl-CoA synthetase